MSFKVAVVILNWNGRKFLEQFLPCVVENSKDQAEVIIADNASTDDSIDFLKKEFPGIRIIQNKTNRGFAKGYNDALSQIDAKYYADWSFSSSYSSFPFGVFQNGLATLQMTIDGKYCRYKNVNGKWVLEHGAFNQNRSCNLRVEDFIQMIENNK